MSRNSGDIAFIAISCALVLLMTPGLAFFYGGLVRDSNILNTMMMSIIAMGVISIIWMLIGFTLAFKGSLEYAGFQSLEELTWPGTDIPGLLFATYQMTFAIIAAAIISGALVERIRFGAFLVLISLWTLLVYVPLCHAVWGGGWIEQMGAKDFAGGTVVHISSGVAALVAAAILGKRNHLDDSKPHNIPFVILGGCLLWFGWLGFNGGSALRADSVAVMAIATSIVAGSGGMVAWVAAERLLDGQPTTVGAMTGVVGGLVAITPCAGFVDAVSALIIGILGSLACVIVTRNLNKLSWVDDSLDAFSLHGVGGFVGAILGGVFDLEDGVIRHGQFRLLGVNTIAALIGAMYSATVTAILFFAMRKVMRVRAHYEQECCGLDAHVHGEDAYRSSSRSALSTTSERNKDKINNQPSWNSPTPASEEPSSASAQKDQNRCVEVEQQVSLTPDIANEV